MNSSVTSWVLISISFTVYFLISFLFKMLRINNLQHALPKMKGMSLLNLRHFIGIVLFGIIFYVACPDFRYLLTDIEVPKLYVLIPFFVIVVLSVKIAFLSARKMQSEGFEIDHYHHSTIVTYFIIRILFLLFYEFFFRGILFYSFLKFNSLTLSIFYTTILYVTIHAFDSKKEITGAIPFGIILCLFTYLTDNIWLAFLAHTALSTAFEISVLNNLTFKNQELCK